MSLKNISVRIPIKRIQLHYIQYFNYARLKKKPIQENDTNEYEQPFSLREFKTSPQFRKLALEDKSKAAIQYKGWQGVLYRTKFILDTNPNGITYLMIKQNHAVIWYVFFVFYLPFFF